VLVSIGAGLLYLVVFGKAVRSCDAYIYSTYLVGTA
jgi:hypothetical protein